MQRISTVLTIAGGLVLAGTPLCTFAANTPPLPKLLPPGSGIAVPQLHDIDEDADADANTEADEESRKAIEDKLETAERRGKIAAAKKGDLKAQVWLGRTYGKWQSAQGQAEAFRWLNVAALAGDADSQWHLAQLYDGGRGVARQRNVALGWYEKAAAQGQADARAELCAAYVLGDGVPRDIDKGLALCRMAGRAGEGKAYYVQGLAFEQGWGSSVNPVQARMNYDIAAASGSPEALDRLGQLAASPEDAAPFFRKAMAAGFVPAAEHLAQQYEAGGDLMAATRLYRYAAMQGAPAGQAWLEAHPEALTALPPGLHLSDVPHNFAVVRLPAMDGAPPTEVNFWDYFNYASDYYPDGAVNEDVDGDSDVICYISAQLKVTDCLPMAETPYGYGFNRAIIRFFDQDIQVLVNEDEAGDPLAGRDFEIKFKWVMD